MNRVLKTWAMILVMMGLSFHSQRSSANEMKAFIMSCTYGVLAGTLVGAATLAFEDQPGENLNKVARGASLGLYAGILLGVYVTQIVPSQMEEEEGEDPNPEDGEEGDGTRESPEEVKVRFQVFPLVSARRGFEGFGTQVQIFAF